MIDMQDRDAIDKKLSAASSKKSGKPSVPGKTHVPGKARKNAIEIKAPPAAGVVSGGQLDTEKKIKTLNKKLKQIDDLKMKQASGGQLELTQISKIASEAVLLDEVISL